MSSLKKLLKIISAILSAAFGVRSSKNMTDDFKASSPFVYIIFGVIFTILFVISLVLIINKLIL